MKVTDQKPLSAGAPPIASPTASDEVRVKSGYRLLADKDGNNTIDVTYCRLESMQCGGSNSDSFSPPDLT